MITVVTSETLLAASNPTSHNPSAGFVGGTIAAGNPNGYTFVLQDSYVGLLDVHVTPVGAPTSGQSVLVQSVVFVNDVTDQTTPSISMGFQQAEVIDPMPNGLVASGIPDGSYLMSVALYNSTAL